MNIGLLKTISRTTVGNIYCNATTNATFLLYVVNNFQPFFFLLSDKPTRDIETTNMVFPLPGETVDEVKKLIPILFFHSC